MTRAPDLADLLLHADRLRAFVETLLADESRVDDVLQETWIAAMERRPERLREPRGWLFGVARNFARMARRGDGRRTRRELANAAPEVSDDDPAETAARVETLQRVTAALLDLDEPYRTTLLLRFFDDLPTPEIAVRMDVPAPTARTRLHRGLAILRERLDARDGDWRAVLVPFAAAASRAEPPAAPTARPWAGPVAVLLMLLAAVVVAVSVLDGPGPEAAVSGPTPRPADPRAAEPVAATTQPTETHEATVGESSRRPSQVAGPVAAESNAPAVADLEPVPATQPLTAPDTDASARAGTPVDPRLPPYVRGDAAIERSIDSVGSDTLNGLITRWAEGFSAVYRAGTVRVRIEGRGSSTAPPALTDGSAQLGPMSRDMTAAEVERYELKHGRKPVRVRVAMDSVAVVVHRDNPIRSLTLTQVDAIFSSSRKRGGKPVTTWGDLGLTGAWADQPIQLHGRNWASGTYGFFKERALAKGDFKGTVNEQPGSASVVQSVSEDRYAIGYAGLGDCTGSVRIVPLSEKDGAAASEANCENVKQSAYPLGRFLNVYVNPPPGTVQDAAAREFLRFALSKEGQEAAVQDGFMPLDADTAAAERRLLGE